MPDSEEVTTTPIQMMVTEGTPQSTPRASDTQEVAVAPAGTGAGRMVTLTPDGGRSVTPAAPAPKRNQAGTTGSDGGSGPEATALDGGVAQAVASMDFVALSPDATAAVERFYTWGGVGGVGRGVASGDEEQTGVGGEGSGDGSGGRDRGAVAEQLLQAPVKASPMTLACDHGGQELMYQVFVLEHRARFFKVVLLTYAALLLG